MGNGGTALCEKLQNVSNACDGHQVGQKTTRIDNNPALILSATAPPVSPLVLAPNGVHTGRRACLPLSAIRAPLWAFLPSIRARTDPLHFQHSLGSPPNAGTAITRSIKVHRRGCTRTLQDEVNEPPHSRHPRQVVHAVPLAPRPHWCLHVYHSSDGLSWLGTTFRSTPIAGRDDII